jgi:kynureninase
MEFGPFPGASGHDRALALDAADPIAAERATFVVTDPDLLYLDGNSLGRLPAAASAVVGDVTHRQWGDRLIRSWNEGWWELPERLGALLAPVVGAGADEVLVSESTSTNLFKLAVAAARARPGRTRIVTDDLNFPTDVHVLDGVARLLGGLEVEVVPSPDGVHGPDAALRATLDDDVALVSLSHVAYRSGHVHDLAGLTSAAHEVGALVLWDCSHSVGSVPLGLAAAGADLAVGCSYKHLNGGPGAPAWLYVRRDLQQELENPITGWFGHAEPFGFDLAFTPAEGIRRFHVGTTPVLSMAAAEAGFAQVARVGIDAVRAKSVALTTFLVEQSDEHLAPLGFTLASPRDPAVRGGHVALRHDDAWPITRALIEDAKVLPDFRSPDVLRLGLAALTTSFLDVHTAVQRIATVVRDGLHEAHRGAEAVVT